MESAVTKLWTAVLGQLQLLVPQASYETWLRSTWALALNGDQLTVGTPSVFAAEWLERQMLTLVQRTLTELAKRPIHVRFVVSSPGASSPAPLFQDSPAPSQANGRLEPSPPPGSSRSPGTNGKYTFDTFVLGAGNQLAYAAASAVAERPGASYNPLFIHSSPGLGKTHLLRAIAHSVALTFPRVLAVSAEQFTNDFIEAIRQRRTEEFRSIYRGADVLLLDDVQFLVGKEQTLEGFFHTFNELQEADRQIVVTSDRPPQALASLEARLVSRFQSGLIVDIQLPDFETRLAILRRKTHVLDMTVPECVLETLAGGSVSNVRQLLGALNRLVAQARLQGSPMTPELAHQVIQDLLPSLSSSPPCADAVIECVAHHYQVTSTDITGKKRDALSSLARHVAIFLLHTDLHLGLSRIGPLVGGRDPSTILSATRRISRLLQSDTTITEALSSLRQKLSSLG